MIKNYIKIAWRNLKKQSFQSILNLIGMVCSITFVLLVSAYIWEVYHVNSQLRNKDQQYSLQSSYKKEGLGIGLTSVGALAKALKLEYPDLVANYHRIDGLTCIISNGQQAFEEGVALGDPHFIEMYGFSLLEGTARTALSRPFTVVISEQAALKYFGHKAVMGKSLEIRNFKGEKHAFTVTAILKKATQNSVTDLNPAMHAEIFLPIVNESYFGRTVDTWQNPYIASFVELREGVTPSQLDKPIRTLIHKHMDADFAANYSPLLKPLNTYFLDDNNGAVRKIIHTLLWISAFVMLMASINFVNITISQNITRLKEFGLRKIMGSTRQQLIGQLLIECILIMLIAALISLPIYSLAKPLFEHVFMRNLPELTQLPIAFFALLIAFTICIGLIAGAYPALKLSQNNVLDSVKNKLPKIRGKQYVRHTLLFVQFAVAIMILVASFVISNQIDLFIHGNLGYNKNALLTVQVPRDWSEEGLQKMETIRAELQRLPEVESISLSYETTSRTTGSVSTFRHAGHAREINAQVISTDGYFANTYQIPLLAGSFLPQPTSSGGDDWKVVISKKAALALGFQHMEDAIGQTITLQEGNIPSTIVGVTGDFVLGSMHAAPPLVVWRHVALSKQFRFFTIRLHTASLSSSIHALEKKWSQLLPDAPFDYQFVEEQLRKIYETELQLQRASQAATFIAFLIVGLGIIGLLSLSIKLRNKEVGVRKVLGASQVNLITLFAKEFYLALLFGILFAIPTNYYIMNSWLQNFAIRIPLTIGTYFIPILFLVLLLTILISVLIIRFTRFNPIEKLRDE